MKWINSRTIACAIVVALPMTLTCGVALAVAVEGGGGRSTFETYVFTGDCQDCALPTTTGILGIAPPSVPVTAELVLQNYLSGNPIDAANLVSFTYNGSAKFAAYSIDASSAGLNITGAMYSSSGTQLAIFDNAEFFDSTAGYPWNWSTGPKLQGSYDQGDNGIWVLEDTSVPEPASLALFGLGLSGLIGMRRRRSK